ncbi:MAG TPA: hypothetical protein PKW49_09940 [Paludibacteraceae bacterium]|nr:hypothetical protein [Paludibacteraceae bacterium]
MINCVAANYYVLSYLFTDSQKSCKWFIVTPYLLISYMLGNITL